MDDPTPERITVSRLRWRLTDVLEEVLQHERRYVVVKRGQPAAVILPVEVYRKLVGAPGQAFSTTEDGDRVERQDSGGATVRDVRCIVQYDFSVIAVCDNMPHATKSPGSLAVRRRTARGYTRARGALAFGSIG